MHDAKRGFDIMLMYNYLFTNLLTLLQLLCIVCFMINTELIASNPADSVGAFSSLTPSHHTTDIPTPVEVIYEGAIDDVRRLAQWGDFVHSPSKRKALRVCGGISVVLTGVSLVALGLLGAKHIAIQDQYSNDNPILVEAVGGEQRLDEVKNSKLSGAAETTKEGLTGALILTLFFGGVATASGINASARHKRPKMPPVFLGQRYSTTLIDS